MIEKIIKKLRFVRNQMFDVPVRDRAAPMQNGLVPIILFLLTIFFYIFYQLAMQPRWVLGGEMWAEMATNYFPNANSPSYIRKLFSRDAGYVPLPQRLIAFFGNQINIPSASAPYLYTWSAIIITGMMVGTFCLAPFRKLIKSNSLRFMTSIAILMVADFETRTFINFTYFAAFFAAIVTALALTDEIEDVPWWAWLLPVLLVSKPAVLAALPAMILVATVSKSRFRWITLVAVVLCMTQLLLMLISAKSGAMPFRANEVSLGSKLIASGKYFFGFLGAYGLGPRLQLSGQFLMLFGVGIFIVCWFVVFFKKSRSCSLIIVGFSLLLFNVLLNSFALSDIWSRDMERLDGPPIHRHIIVGFFGCVIVFSGLVSALTTNKIHDSNRFHRDIFSAFPFFLWFTGAGWLSFAGELSRDPASPTINNSQWQVMAGAIDSGVSPLCVPVDPWVKGASWMYKINCDLLKPAPVWDDGAALIDNPLFFDIIPPSSVSEKILLAAAVLVRPLPTKKSFIEIKMVIDLVGGGKEYYYGSRDVDSSGALVLLNGEGGVPFKNISSVRLIFNSPVEIALAAGDPAGVPGVAWMGN